MARFILMRGLSGSGKTYLAQKMAERQNGVVFSHENAENDNNFNEEDELLSHYVSQRKVYDAMKEGIKLIIMDACHIRPMVATPYIRVAKKFNYDWEIFSPATDWARSPTICWQKCNKKTPLSTIAEQNRLLTKIPVQVFRALLKLVEPFNPHECVREAQLAMEDENPNRADELVLDYEEWRKDGGFPSWGGDDAIKNISEKLEDWRKKHWESVNWLL